MNYTAILKNAIKWERGDTVVIYGEIYNDKKGRWSSGVPIRTSLVTYQSDKQEDGSFMVKTLNSTYKVFYKEENSEVEKL